MNAFVEKSYLSFSLCLHVAACALLFIFYQVGEKIEKRRVVHVSSVKLNPHSTPTTVSQAPPQIEPLVQTAPALPKEEKKPEVKKAEEKKPEEKKKETPKKEDAKKETPKKKDTPKKETPKADPKKTEAKKEAKAEVKKAPLVDPKKEALLKEARESLAKMGKGEATSLKSDRSAITPLTSLKAEDGLFSVKVGDSDFYSGELSKRLKLSLRLPEIGEVVVDMILKKTGQVARVTIRESKSAVNRKYVENTLPTVSFPSFGEYYPKEDEKLFTLSLQNALY